MGAGFKKDSGPPPMTMGKSDRCREARLRWMSHLGEPRPHDERAQSSARRRFAHDGEERDSHLREGLGEERRDLLRVLVVHSRVAEQVLYQLAEPRDLVPVVERLPAAATSVPAIVEQSGPPAGSVTTTRDLVPLAIGAGVVGVTLTAVLLLLVVLLFL